jgi:tetratricopeptide (TPR) repeat protein
MRHRPVATLLSKDTLQQQQLDYAVDGTIKKVGRNYHIDVWLLDLSQCTRPVWSDRFELGMHELHRLNDLVTGRIVASIDPIILFIEGRPRQSERYGATGLLLLALPLIYSMERQKYQHAGNLIQRALAIEPDNSMAVTLLAYWHLWHVGQGWTTDPVKTFATMETLCLRAMELDPENSEAMGIYAHSLAWKRDFDQAVRYFDRALRLNPNLASVWALSAATYCYIGEPDEALRRLSRHRDLCPIDPYFSVYENIYVIAYTFKRDYERAVIVGRRVVKSVPEFINGYKPLMPRSAISGAARKPRPTLRSFCHSSPTSRSRSSEKPIPLSWRRIATITARAYASPASGNAERSMGRIFVPVGTRRQGVRGARRQSRVPDRRSDEGAEFVAQTPCRTHEHKPQPNQPPARPEGRQRDDRHPATRGQNRRPHASGGTRLIDDADHTRGHPLQDARSVDALQAD